MRHKYLLLILGSLIVVGLFGGVASATEKSKKYAVIKTNLNVRKEASATSKIVTMLKAGNKVLITKQLDKWLLIEQGTVKGYISSSSKYISIEVETKKIVYTAPKPIGVGKPRPPGPVQQADPIQIGKVVNTVTQLNFRSVPSTAGSRLRYLSGGEQFKILSKPNDSWYEIEDLNGVRGYVSSSAQYVTLMNSTEQPTTPTEPTPTEPTPTEPTPAEPTPAEPTPTDPPIIPVEPAIIDENTEKAIMAGQVYFGVPYQYGADRNSVATFDCSSFVRRAFLDGIGLDLPWDSRMQAQYVNKRNTPVLAWSELKRGDLIFFTRNARSLDNSRPFDEMIKEVNHVGIYMGDGTMLNSNGGSTNGVQISSISLKYWNTHFLFGGSIFVPNV